MKLEFRKGLLAIMLLCSTIGFSQLDSTQKLSRHQLGFKLDFGGARFYPGIQYFYSLNQKNQLGVTLGVNRSWVNGKQVVFKPHMQLEYRHIWRADKALSFFAGPALSYELMMISDNVCHRFGVGANLGIQYDFSRHNTPLVLGIQRNPEISRAFGRFLLDNTTSVSLRWKL